VVGEYIYNGKEQTVELLVKAGDMIVNAGDYKITGNTGTDAGDYSATITGINSFAGEVEVKWTIEQQEITVKVDDITMGDADGLPTFTVKDADGNEIDAAVLNELDLKFVVSDENGEIDIVNAAKTKGVYTVTAKTENANYDLKVIDGTLTVKHYVAEVNGTRYETLQEAVDEAADGGFVTLLDNAGLALVQKSLTIVRDGYSATVAALEGYTVESDAEKYVVKPYKDVVETLGGLYAYIDEDNSGTYDEAVDGPLGYLQETLYRAAKG